MNACGNCKHLRREQESWELPHIWWWDCARHPARANLRSFPFHHTTCKSFETRHETARTDAQGLSQLHHRTGT